MHKVQGESEAGNITMDRANNKQNNLRHTYILASALHIGQPRSRLLLWQRQHSSSNGLSG